jgi:hypothetical protein
MSALTKQMAQTNAGELMWKIDWHGTYDIEDFTTGTCPYCSKPGTLYAKYDAGGYHASILCRNKCGFELYVMFMDDGSNRVGVAGVYYATDNYSLYLGDKRWAYYLADGSDSIEEGKHDNRIDIHAVAIKLRKLTLLT